MLILSMSGTSPIVAGNETSGDGFIEMLGGINIYKIISGWKTVSLESIISNNPDFIIIPQKDVHKNSDLKSLKENPALKDVIAIKNDNILMDDGMAILGFGPRTIKSALRMSKIISEVDE